MCQFVKNALFHHQTNRSKSNKYRPVLIVNVHYCKIDMYTCRQQIYDLTDSYSMYIIWRVALGSTKEKGEAKFRSYF